MSLEKIESKKEVKTPFWQILLLIVFGILTAVLTAEIAVRILTAEKLPVGKTAFKSTVHETVSDLDLLYKLTPDSENIKDEILHKINKHGFRDREVSVEKKAGVTRILFLGDSVVYGYQISAEQTLPKQLEEKLLQRGRKVEVFNFGVSGYETRQQVEFFKLVGRQFKPDIVILGYTLNDSRFASFELNQFNEQNKWHVPYGILKWSEKMPNFFYRNFRLLRYLDREHGVFDKFKKCRFYLRREQDIWHYLRDRNKLLEDKEDSPYRKLKEKIIAEAQAKGTKEDDLKAMLEFSGFDNYCMYNSHWNISKSAIQELNDLAKEDGFKLIAAPFPFLWSLDHYPMKPLHDFLKNEFDEMDIPVIDSLKYMQGLTSDEKKKMTLDGVHFSSTGSSLWADFAAKSEEL